MLWEKKIELEKETQAALDPEAGMAECRGMEREIHRYVSFTPFLDFGLLRLTECYT